MVKLVLMYVISFKVAESIDDVKWRLTAYLLHELLHISVCIAPRTLTYKGTQQIREVIAWYREGFTEEASELDSEG